MKISIHIVINADSPEHITFTGYDEKYGLTEPLAVLRLNKTGVFEGYVPMSRLYTSDAGSMGRLPREMWDAVDAVKTIIRKQYDPEY